MKLRTTCGACARTENRICVRDAQLKCQNKYVENGIGKLQNDSFKENSFSRYAQFYCGIKSLVVIVLTKDMKE